MKKIILILTVIITVFFYSCEKEEDPILGPEPQEIQATIYYDGVGKEPIKCYHLHVYIYDEENKMVLEEDVCVTYESMNKGLNLDFDHRKLPPGKYDAAGWWDWENDGLYDRHDPQTSVGTFEIDGFNESHFILYLIDEVSPTDEGWMEGEIICYESYNSPLCISARNFNTGEITKEEWLPAHNFTEEPSLKYTLELPAGEYDVQIYIDLNENSGYDYPAEPRKGRLVQIFPGYPERDINFNFN